MPDFAPNRDGAAMQADQVSHQGEADPASLVRAALLPLHTMEALEQQRQVPGRNTHAGVADAELRVTCHRPHAHADAALEGEFEGIGEEVEDDLLPHIPVHIDRLRWRLASDIHLQARVLAERAEAGRQLRGESGEIGGLVRRLDAACLHAREVQQCVHQLEQAQPIAVGNGHQYPLIGRNFILRLG
jgi:hypothetical protein